MFSCRKKTGWIYLLTIWLAGAHASGQQVTVSGQVRDAQSGELLIGATVWDSTFSAGTRTNTYGFFSLTLPNWSGSLRFSFVGYTPYYPDSPGSAGTPLDIRLVPTQDLSEITIVETLHRPAGSLSIPVHLIRSMPALLGEADVLKTLSFTPGVSTGTEGSAGLYVRGGTPDQNLMLLDEAPVYNVMHLGGFFSVFNPASLKSVGLYKGAFPARYGGRLSSVIDLTMKDGNNQKMGGEIGLGLLNQNLTIEGPIVKDKASFIVSGRISTLGLTTLLTKKRPASGSGEDYIYRFYDLNAKVNYQINKTDHLYLSFYNGFDRFTYEEWQNNAGKAISTAVANNWGNATGTLRYSKMINPRLFARANVIFSRYTSEFNNDYEDFLSNETRKTIFRHTDASVSDIGVKMQFDYFPAAWLTLKLGSEITRHHFNPFSTATNYQGNPGRSVSGIRNATRLDGFADADIALTTRLKLNTGIRYSLYRIEDRNFRNPEPRLGISWKLLFGFTAKGAASIMNQYLHLLTNNGYGFGYDAWVPSTPKAPPSRGRQLSLSLDKELSRPGIVISLDAYLKATTNLIDYPDGTNFTGLLADSWDNMVLKDGRGKTKGIEFMARKETGRLNGHIAYTWSKSELKFDDINEGEWFPMKYDRRHHLSVVAGYELNKKWVLNGTFTWQTGHTVTLPHAALLNAAGNQPRFVYNERHNGRMPAFHRADLGVIRHGSIWKDRKTQLGLGVYNLYNRANPLYLDFGLQHDSQTGQRSLTVRQYSLFPVLPYITYSVKF